MRLHLVSLPHTQTTSDYFTCAYTNKLIRFGKMMRPLGYEVFIYGGEENEAECDEFVPLISKKECEEWFGVHDTNRFFPITWNPNDIHWTTMNGRAIQAIKEKRSSKEDLVLLIAGNCQQQIATALPEMTACEWGVGYEGVFTNYCAFESHTWRHFIYGKQDRNDGRWYDTVIPNFFDPEDFATGAKGDYLLFIGRIIQRKGPHIAAMIAERAGLPIVIAGNGATHTEEGLIVTPEVTIRGDHVRYAGPVAPQERSTLMAGAIATIVPTIYVEPFGGVAVESMLAGTPVIASNWGAFVETVQPGVSGERFHTLQEGADAVEKVRGLDPEAVRQYALDRYSLDAVAPQYDRWFRQLHGLWGVGWDA